MQRSPSWLSALAQAAGRLLGVVDSGPILPTRSPQPRGSINGEEPADPWKGVGAHAAACGGEPVGFPVGGMRLPADKWIAQAADGAAAASVWIDVARKYPFTANPITGGGIGAY
jgi:hypothetical protein